MNGERCPKLLASYRDKRCKNSLETIEKSLTGCYREEHVFSLTQALELYETYQQKIAACDEQIEERLLTLYLCSYTLLIKLLVTPV